MAPEGSRIEKTTAIVGLDRARSFTTPSPNLIWKRSSPTPASSYGDAARFAPNTGNHTAFVLVNLVTGHEGKTENYIAECETTSSRVRWPGFKISFQTGGIIGDVLNFGLKAPIDIQIKGSEPRTSSVPWPRKSNSISPRFPIHR